MSAARLPVPCVALCLLAPAALPGVACRKGVDPLPTVTTKTGVMVRIPGGWFEMGSADGRPNEAPAHRVWVDAFLMDRCEVTQDQFRLLEISDPSNFKGLQRPVEHMTLAEVIVYCNLRSDADKLRPFYVFQEDTRTWRYDFEADGYRLPTEAEWEYACRAGTTGRRHFEGDDQRDLERHAWYAANAEKQTHPVGRKRPNPWGLCDMYGNVAEWCHDWYDPKYYTTSPPPHNPRGPAAGELVVLRGGGWDAKDDRCRSAWRAGENPRLHDACFAKDTIGFRCVRRPPD